MLRLYEELETLKREASEEKNRRTACELEIRDLKEKVKALEKTAGDSSANALAANRESVDGRD
ncbi:hypothetical protein Bca52824_018369 [Brassica carinata]|uniref:Uncharacterized protein n=1 Tax=Brassica carinata TaxID=52824 RepID=A0A8X8AYF6_BRACI|nr:hypothetical protein Bca52824_018369 [Brassica carinata]